MEITLEEIQKKFEELPEDLKWAIIEAKVDDSIIEIGKEQNLNVDQTGQLSLETHMVIFGITPEEKFNDSIKTSLNLNDEKTNEVINAINEKILKKIRENLMSSSQEKKEEEKKEDASILNTAGIEIMPEEITAPVKEEVIKEKASDMLSDVENPELIKIQADKEKIESITAQKLSGSFKTPSVKTEYTLNNLSKQNTGTVAPVATPSADTATKTIKVDPYREIPE